MKNSYLLIIQLVLILLFCNIGLFAQEYHPFPTKNTVWAEYFHPSRGYYPNSYHYFSLKDNDTIIHGNHYQKLYLSYDTIFAEDKLCGGLREENKRIYYYSINAINCTNLPVPVDTEIILYDFNLQLGDTITYNEFRVRVPGKMIILKIDSILIGSEYRKVYNFGYNGNIEKEAKWVEGVGCLEGLLADIGYAFNDDLKSDLICFIQEDEVLYHDYHPDCYNFNQATVPILSTNPNIKIIPNPVGSSARIEFEKPEYQKLVISDQTGKKLKEYNLEGKHSLEINKGELPGGLYFLLCYNKAGTVQSLKILFR
jgi:hypothetical protein